MPYRWIETTRAMTEAAELERADCEDDEEIGLSSGKMRGSN